MNNSQIVSNKESLDFLFGKIELFSDNFELQSHWARYLCVLVSGFLEKSVSLILKEYSKRTSSPFVANFVEKKISRFQNANMEKIIQLVSSFNSDWADTLDEELDIEVKTSVDSIVANKNNIAHGISVGITYTQVKKYYRGSIRLIEKMEDVCC